MPFPYKSWKSLKMDFFRCLNDNIQDNENHDFANLFFFQTSSQCLELKFVIIYWAFQNKKYEPTNSVPN